MTADQRATADAVAVPRPAVATREGQRVTRKLADWQWFLVVFAVALVIFAATDAGRMIFDTKLGVDIDAREFLVRLWSLWNPLEWFGSLQNQYIGYAIPMAPFFLAGQLLHVPVWLIERLWMALLVAVGFTGMLKLARALQVGTDTAQVIAASLFTLWPAFTIVIGSTSATALPGLMVPWATLPLISAVRGRCAEGKAVARSGLAIVAMSGVNAVTTLAVLVLPALFLLTHGSRRQRIRLTAKWAAAAVAATAWWAIPLLLQGRYSYNFLPYIEQSSTTARTMSADAVLRGAGFWTAYFNIGSSPWLSAGWSVVSSAAAILASTAAAAAGLAGLARRDMPERRWLCACVGLVAAVALSSYYGPLGGPWHAVLGSLLNGPLAPVRSLYKLEPVIAVALALGTAHALDRYGRLSLPLGRSARLSASAIVAPVLVLTLAGLAVPQLSGQVLQPGSFSAVPRYWSQVSAYLAAHSAEQTALVVPADAHGQFTWGETIDDPLEPLASSPWAERGLVPYGGAGSQVLLETAEQAVESGQDVPGLTAYLARAGIRYVVVRNDISPSEEGYTPPQTVNETLALSGFRRVAAFGPAVKVTPSYPDIGLSPGLAASYPSVEIFQAADAAVRPISPVTALPVSRTILVNGGPDSLLQLDAQNLLPATSPTVIAGDKLAGSPAMWAVTDGQRRADNDFGTTVDYQSFTYTATEVNPPDDSLGGAGQPPRQILPVSAAGHQTVAVLSGAGSVTASSDGNWLTEDAQSDPVNAFDGNPATAWTEGNADTPVGQWIQITFNHTIDLPASVGIELLDDSVTRSIANQLKVTTATGSATTDTVATGTEQPLKVPSGPTRWLRITITGASNARPGYPGAGITDVEIPGVRVTNYLQPAEDPAGERAAATVYSFSQQVSASYQSQSGQSASQGLDRIFVTPSASRLTARITALPEPGAGLDSLVRRLTPVGKGDLQVTASSTWNSDPEFGPDNLFNSKTDVPWLDGAGDPQPALGISWRGKRAIREIVLAPSDGVATMPTSVLIGSPAGDRLEKVGPGGVVTVSPPLWTNRLYLIFGKVSAAAGDPAAGQPSQLPLGLAKVEIPALHGLQAAVPSLSAAFRLACGQGPSITVDGRQYQTAVSGTIGDLIELKPVTLQLCTPGSALTLPAGRQRLATRASANFAVTNLSLSSARTGTGSRASTVGATRILRVLSWQADSRELRIGPGSASYVEVHQNFNAGWKASLNGRPLRAATLDGWQQAFIVPAGQGGTIRLTYSPDATYHAGLLASAVALLILLGVAVAPLRRRRRKTSGRMALLAFIAGNEPETVPPGRTPQRPAAGPPGSDATAGMPRTSGRIARIVLALLPVTAVILVSGGPVAAVVPLLAVLGWRGPRWLPGVAAAAMCGAGLIAATARTPTVLGSGPFSGPAQFCALVALAAALMPALRPPRGPLQAGEEQA